VTSEAGAGSTDMPPGYRRVEVMFGPRSYESLEEFAAGTGRTVPEVVTHGAVAFAGQWRVFRRWYWPVFAFLVAAVVVAMVVT
jgi:hypothetical protein